jgi:hypothetical protein
MRNMQVVEYLRVAIKAKVTRRYDESYDEVEQQLMNDYYNEKIDYDEFEQKLTEHYKENK